jgi:hypothetical protein
VCVRVYACVFILCLCCPVFKQRPCDGPITRPRSPTDCVNPKKKLKPPVRVRYKRNGHKKGIYLRSHKMNFFYGEELLALEKTA